MSSILRDWPRPLTEIRAEVPEGVWRLAARCLEKSPGDRAQSAQDIHAELRDLRRAWESGASRLAGSAGRSTTPPRSTSSAIRSPAADRVASIAVMPFADLSPGGDQEWFCDGVAEEILNALTPFRNLRVAARASAFSLRGRSDDLKTIGEKLSVTTVLGGSVRRSGDRVRITVQLSEVETGFQLWSERYDREVNDIFEIQDDIATAVAARLKVTLADGPLDRLARLVERGTTNIDAYQLYLQGRALLTRRGAGMRRALELFQQAVALDPTYSVAWAAIAEAHTVLAYFGIGARRGVQAARHRGGDTRHRAVSVLSGRPCRTRPAPSWPTRTTACRAKHAFDRALALNPHYVQGRCWYALFYLQWVAGEFDRGPGARTPRARGRPALRVRHDDRGGMPGHRRPARRGDRDGPAGNRAGPRVCTWRGGNTAWSWSKPADSTRPSPCWRRHRNRRRTHWNSSAWPSPTNRPGGTPMPPRSTTASLGRAAERYVAQAYLALSAAAAGRPDEAIAHARAAWDDREPPFILFARHYPQWRPLHADPRMQSILREMNAPAEDAR